MSAKIEVDRVKSGHTSCLQSPTINSAHHWRPGTVASALSSSFLKVVAEQMTSPSRNGTRETVMGVLATNSSGLIVMSLRIRSFTEAFSSPSSFMIIPYAISVTEMGRGLSMIGVPDIEMPRLNNGSDEKSWFKTEPRKC